MRGRATCTERGVSRSEAAVFTASALAAAGRHTPCVGACALSGAVRINQNIYVIFLRVLSSASRSVHSQVESECLDRMWGDLDHRLELVGMRSLL